MGPQAVISFIVVLWCVVAGIVIGYPPIAGRIRMGSDSVSREEEPQDFWKAYALSRALFMGVSSAAVFFLRSITR